MQSTKNPLLWCFTSFWRCEWPVMESRNRLNVYSCGLAECYIQGEICPFRPDSLLHYGCFMLFWQCKKTWKDTKIIFAFSLCSDSPIQRWYTVHTTVLYVTGKILRDYFSPSFLRNANKLTNAELIWCHNSTVKIDPQQLSCAFSY